MFDLKHASIGIRKAAYLEGIRSDRHSAWYKPMTDNEHGVKAIVGDDKHDDIEIDIFDIEYVNDLSWREVKDL